MKDQNDDPKAVHLAAKQAALGHGLISTNDWQYLSHDDDENMDQWYCNMCGKGPMHTLVSVRAHLEGKQHRNRIKGTQLVAAPHSGGAVAVPRPLEARDADSDEDPDWVIAMMLREDDDPC